MRACVHVLLFLWMHLKWLVFNNYWNDEWCFDEWRVIVIGELILTDYYNYLCKTVRSIIFPGKSQCYGFCVKPGFISRYKSFYCLCCNRAVTGYVIKIDSDTRYKTHERKIPRFNRVTCCKAFLPLFYTEIERISISSLGENKEMTLIIQTRN